MNICLFEDDQSDLFAPLSLTRAVFDIRVGATSIAGLVERLFPDVTLLHHTRPELAATTASSYDSLVNHIPEGLDVLFLNSRWIPERNEFAKMLVALASSKTGRLFMRGDSVVAAWVPGAKNAIVANGPVTAESFDGLRLDRTDCHEVLLNSAWDVLARLNEQLDADFDWFSGGYNVFERPGADIHSSAILLNGERIFVGTGSRVMPGVILNAEEGPIVIDKDAEIHERAVIRGPAYIGPNAHINVGADLRAVAIGQHCKVGGEVHNVIFQSFSNKGHDGFLGNSFVGSWCNLGAGTTNSNLRNDYGIVDSYSYAEEAFVTTGLQFAGLMMGDHSKCSIGTNFNTGTTIGVNCNLYGSRFHPRNVPSFCWGGEQAYSTYRLDKALEVAEKVMLRRSIVASKDDQEVLESVFLSSTAARDAFIG